MLLRERAIYFFGCELKVELMRQKGFRVGKAFLVVRRPAQRGGGMRYGSGRLWIQCFISALKCIFSLIIKQYILTECF